MPIINSVRNVLPGMGTSGLRGGTASGPSPQTVTSQTPLSMGKLRVQSDTAGAIEVTGTDGVNPPISLVSLPAGTAPPSIVADFVADQNMTTFVCTATGTIDFEVYGQPGAVT